MPQPMSNAERQKKYRERLKVNNPDKYEEKRQAHLENVKNNKRKIAELSENEKEKRREKWKIYSSRYYNKRKDGNHVTASGEDKIKELEKKWRQKERKMQKHISELMETARTQIKTYRCMRRQIFRLKKQVETMSQNENITRTGSDDLCCLLIDTCTHNAQKANQCIAQSKLAESLTNINIELTPSKKTDVFINTLSSVDEVDKVKLKDKILELNVLSDSLKLNYESATKSDKKIFKKIVKNPLTQKYKFVTKLSKKTIGLMGRIRKSGTIIGTARKGRIQEIHNFFNRDDVTRCTSGKKETKTKNKVKVQRKYLLDSIKELHKKYKENGGKASYTSLLRHRPFYVLNPKLENCDTCACIKHANFKFKISKLHHVGIIKTTNINELLTEISCNLNSKLCMYSECCVCSTKTNNIEADLDFAASIKITWLQWCLKKIQYQKIHKDGNVENLETKKFRKEVMECTLIELIAKFQEEAKLFKKHIFNISHQQKIFRESKENIKDDEAVLICDFSENYQCRYNTEIQGMHFGSSRNQITLHTGVLYIKNQKPTSFCTLSPSNEHNPFSIWAHLTPVINTLKYQYPQINKIHFFSDGPSTQYRQKLNFILFSKRTKQLGFNHCTWNYFESAHGKNAADGIGGAIKRKLDSYVSYGSDIPDAAAAFQLLKRTSTISLYFISETDIHTMQAYLADKINPLKGTMSVHQIVTSEDEELIKYRDVSCLCGEIRGQCTCFNIKTHILIKKANSTGTADYAKEPELVLKKNTKNKVTLLSDITFGKDNKFIGYKNLPSCLRKIDKNTDLISGPHTSQKRAAKEIKKSTKRRRRSSSITTTSESGEVSVYSDCDLLDTLSDVHNDNDTTYYSDSDTKKWRLKTRIVKDKTEIITETKEKNDEKDLSSKAINRDGKLHEVDWWKIEEIQENYRKENERDCEWLDIDTIDVSGQELHMEHNEDKYRQIDNIENMMEAERDDVDETRVMQVERIEQKLEINCNINNEELKEINKTEEGLQTNNEREKDSESVDKVKLELQKENAETKADIYNIGDTVLVRYYIKKRWRYYTGVVENINAAEQLYTISFYKTVSANYNLKFRKPFRLDKDTVPFYLVLKRIEIIQVSENPKEYVLRCEEDQTYFK